METPEPTKITVEFEIPSHKTREDVLVAATNAAKACEEAYGIPAQVKEQH